MKVQNKCKMHARCQRNVLTISHLGWMMCWLPGYEAHLTRLQLVKTSLIFFYVGTMDCKAANNRPYPSCSKPLFQSKASCKSIDMKVIINSYANKTRFHRKSLLLASFWKWEVLELGNGQFFYKQVICQVRDKTWPDKETVWSDKTKQNKTTKHKCKKKNQVKEQNWEFTEEL